MTPEEKTTYLQYRLTRAKETLAEARTLFQADFLSGTMNRIYYAMFYAVSALALSKGFSTSSHMQLRGYFNREFVKTGIVPVELGKLYGEMFDNRTTGDYDDLVVFEKDDISSLLERAGNFIQTLTQIVQQDLEGSKSFP